ncbi:hypothetical protein TSUD_104470 [Trifolium subterraneum]|uniref:Uncharacterized protein n=1 Tax=Trifolium subterraneum TaxID=3900 RepID=A0A2Z6M6Z6_TRISU|nr:hypothetical protein TSUD_104470 [Trifolium subterraneum]
MDNMDLFMVVFSQMWVSEFNHNIHRVTPLIACQFLGVRLDASRGWRIMIQERIDIKITNSLCVVNYNKFHSYTIFASIEKLLCTNTSRILVTSYLMVVMFRFGLGGSLQLNLVGANLTIFTGHSMTWTLNGTGCFLYAKWSLQFQQWDPGGCALVCGAEPLTRRPLKKTLYYHLTTLCQVSICKNWDPGGNDYFIYLKSSLHFKQWDPGGCYLVKRECSLDLERLKKLLFYSNLC